MEKNGNRQQNIGGIGGWGAMMIHGILGAMLLLGRVAQSVICLTADSCLTAYPRVVSLIPARRDRS